MKPPSHRVLSGAAAAGTVILIWAAAASALRGHPPSGVALLFALAFVPYTGLLVWPPPSAPRRAAVGAGAVAAVAGAVLVLAPPVLSDDLYRYLWDGRVLLHGHDPYRWTPNDPALAPLRDATWTRINNRHVPTIYPPLAQGVFALAAALGGVSWVKLLALLGHVGLVPLVARAAGPKRGATAAWAWALNPLALAASALSGHVDVLVGFAVLAFVLALERGRTGAALGLAAVASGVKLVGLVLAPLAGRQRRVAGLAALGLASLALVPLLGAGEGSSATGGLGHYARRWRGNESGFAVVEAAIRPGIALAAEATSAGPKHVQLAPLRPALAGVRGTALDPWAGVLGEKKEVPDVATFEVDYLTTLLARGLVAAIVLGLTVGLVWRRTEPRTAARAVLWAVLLLAPQVHPWYVLWLLPLEVACGRHAALVWSATVLAAYGPLDGWTADRQWVEMPMAQVAQYGLVLGMLAFESARASAAQHPSGGGWWRWGWERLMPGSRAPTGCAARAHGH